MLLTKPGALCLVMISQLIWPYFFINRTFFASSFDGLNSFYHMLTHYCFPDLVNVFEVFLPQLLLYPNPSDPLNGEAAALMMRDRAAYEQKVKGMDHVQHSKFPIMLSLKCQCLGLRSTMIAPIS